MSDSEILERVAVMPSEFAADYLKKQLLPNATFKAYYDAFTKEGFKFIPERVQVIMGLGTTAGSPVLLAVVPSFRKFDASAASHDAVSIVVFRNGPHTGIAAARVTVNHRPYEIASLSIIEMVSKKMVTHTMERDALKKAPTRGARLSKLLPVPRALGTVPLDTLSTEDIQALAEHFYHNLLMDHYAKPLYPPQGLQTMTADTALVQKFSLAENARFVAAATTRKLKVVGKCTSTSTSSNACSSTSTSVGFE